jgi:hypothetical protein
MGNGSVNTFPRLRTRTKEYKNGVFYVVRAEIYPGQLEHCVELTESSAREAVKIQPKRESEESRLLEDVTRKWLEKTQ